MPTSLAAALRILREHEPELRRRGVTHAAVFGSVARGEASASSDVDVLIDLDPERPTFLITSIPSSTSPRSSASTRLMARLMW